MFLNLDPHIPQAEACACITSEAKCLQSVWATALFSSRVQTVTSVTAGTPPQCVRFLPVSQFIKFWLAACVYTSCESLMHVLDFLIMFYRTTHAYMCGPLIFSQAVIWRFSIIRSLPLCWLNQWIRGLKRCTSSPACAPFAWVSSKVGGRSTGEPRHVLKHIYCTYKDGQTLLFHSIFKIIFVLIQTNSIEC